MIGVLRFRFGLELGLGNCWWKENRRSADFLLL